MRMTLKESLTFDDVLLVPQASSLSPKEVVVDTLFTKQIKLSIPLVSAAMDTVTEGGLALALTKAGGIGVIHRNCSVSKQVGMVRQVLRAAKNFAASTKKKIQKNLVAAACGPFDLARAQALDKAGVQAIVIDTAHAHKPDIVKSAKKIKKLTKAQLVVGNIATAQAAKEYLTFADAVKVGIGPGSICTTRVVAGIGVPQLTAIMAVARVARPKKVPVIADGGIRFSGDIVKALAAGADSVMLGSLFAGAKEAPGQLIRVKGKKFKVYRGMGSLGVMQGGQSQDRYFQLGLHKFVPEGVEGTVAYKGSLANIVFQLIGGLRSGMGYLGAQNLAELRRRAHFIRITQAGRIESHPHDVILLKQPPNY